ncbi:hypothetical protein MNBD_GAMMA13-919 [hydrothermal vent metagenome]|uniref:Uncharacterized protein n=1 Tax=hydrothermal vent metagenome TaxID=652676 RepID=A0A3B0Z1B1_9ZZZZ
MKCENVNKSRGVFMLLALILLLAASFPSHEVQAAGLSMAECGPGEVQTEDDGC